MYVRQLTEEIERKAREELNERPGGREECLSDVRGWIEREYHIKFRPEGLWLLNYIRGCKFRPDSVKHKFNNYLSLDATVPEMFSKRDLFLPEIQNILQKGAIIPFGTPDKECVLIKWDALQFESVNFYDVMKVATMVYDVFMNESDTCMAVGHYAIIDFSGLSFSLLKQMTPFTLRRVFYNIFLSYPFRLSAIYCINCPGFMQTLVNLIKPFMSKKLASRVSFYGGDLDEIFPIIPKRYFPKEFGGDAESMAENIAFWKQKIESYREWFLEDYTKNRQKIRRDDSYDSYDIHESFKKLEVD